MQKPVIRWWRKRWEGIQWPAIAVLAAGALILGYTGFLRYNAFLGESRTPLDLLYLTLQLFTLESGALSGIIPWELEIARFLAPVIAAFAALKALAIIFREQLQWIKVKFLRNHVVICGLGRKGMLLARRFRELGEKVLVIELDEGNDSIDQCRDTGAVVFAGDASDPDMLKKIRVHKAKYLVSVCGDDGINAVIAIHSRALAKSKKGSVLTSIVHVFDAQLCHLLREQEIETGVGDEFRLEFFNVYERGARAWLKKHPPRSRLLVVGVGQLGECLIVQSALEWKNIHGKNGEKLSIDILDKKAQSKKRILFSRYPSLKNYCDMNDLQWDLESAEFQGGEFLFDALNRCRYSCIFICLDNDSLGLSTAMSLYQKTKKFSVPIVVRMAHDEGLASLLAGEERGDSRFSEIFAFGLLNRTCTPELLLYGTNERLARVIHEDYVFRQTRLGYTPEKNPSLVPWEDLSDALKESNRRQADHIGKKLRAVGCEIESSFDWDVEPIEFDPEEIEIMAMMEHERWREDHIQKGWTYMPGPKNPEKKKNPHLVPWEKLSDEKKEDNRNAVRAMGRFLVESGFSVCRKDKTNTR